MGNKRTCNIRFTGRIAVHKATLPFAIPVNAKYQSVQGVTINIMKPIQSAGCSDRKTAPNPHANKGVHKKLIIKLELANFLFNSAFFKSLLGRSEEHTSELQS